MKNCFGSLSLVLSCSKAQFVLVLRVDFLFVIVFELVLFFIYLFALAINLSSLLPLKVILGLIIRVLLIGFRTRPRGVGGL
jgi:hypothetical protein